MRRRAIGERNTTDLHRNIYKLYVHKALRWMLLIMPVLIPFFRENGLELLWSLSRCRSCVCIGRGVVKSTPYCTHVI